MIDANEPQIKRTFVREVFLHLLAIFTLYGSATSFGVLLFQYINYFFPNPQSPEGFYSGRAILTPLRFAISTLVVVYPVFIAVSRFLNKSYLYDAAKRDFRLRKWLIYFTLFVAAIIIMGDLVAIVNNFLGGETTFRFILKSVSVIFIAGLVFGYYLYDVRRTGPSKFVKRFTWSVSIIVAAAVIGGFFLAGSPKEERLYRFDQQRINDLQNIQSHIINYWQRKIVLPENLDNLKDNISGYMVPVDPQTDAPYDYHVKKAQNLTFELCAIFNRSSSAGIQKSKSIMAPQSTPYGIFAYGQNWDHREGKNCFERTIDKELYPSLEKPALK